MPSKPDLLPQQRKLQLLPSTAYIQHHNKKMLNTNLPIWSGLEHNFLQMPMPQWFHLQLLKKNMPTRMQPRFIPKLQSQHLPANLPLKPISKQHQPMPMHARTHRQHKRHRLQVKMPQWSILQHHFTSMLDNMLLQSICQLFEPMPVHLRVRH